MISFMLCYNHLLHNKMLCGNIQFYSVSLSNHKLLPYETQPTFKTDSFNVYFHFYPQISVLIIFLMLFTTCLKLSSMKLMSEM